MSGLSREEVIELARWECFATGTKQSYPVDFFKMFCNVKDGFGSSLFKIFSVGIVCFLIWLK